MTQTRKQKKLSIITGSKKLKNSVITNRHHCCQLTTMDFKGYGNALAKQKRKIINGLLYKLLISNPFVISFLHVCFYVPYPMFLPFWTG